MRNHYEAPDLYAIEFISQDIITVSDSETNPPILDNDPENDAEWD